jgi:Bacterial membrane protein YfhO
VGVARLVAVGVARWRPAWATWLRAPPRRGAVVVGVGVLGLAVLAPAWTQIDAFGATNAEWISAQHAAESTQGGEVDRLIDYVHVHGGGRVYAGMPSNWGSNFVVGAVPVFKYLESRDVDEVGYTLRTASLMTDPEYFFDEQNPGDYALFAVHYLILPAGHPPPVPARLVLHAGTYQLWVVPDRGYVRVVDTVGVLSADKTDVGTMSVPYLRSGLPGAGRYLTVAYAGAAPAPLTAPTVSGTTGAAGRVRSEHDDLVNGTVRAVVVTRRRAAVVLSASYDPGWSVTVDGHRAPVEMLAPALPSVRVGPGVHTIVFAYRGFGAYPVLFGVLVVTVAVLVWAGPLDGWRRVRVRRLSAPPDGAGAA